MDELADNYLKRYAAEIYMDTAFFAGVEPLLQTLSGQGIKVGIVTNKPTGLTESLLRTMGIEGRFEVLVCGDTLTRAKPHADPILHAMKQLGVTATQTLYVGDSSRDMEAARAAGCGAVAVSWGYIEADDDIMQWPADHVVDQPEQLLPLLNKATRELGV